VHDHTRLVKRDCDTFNHDIQKSFANDAKLYIMETSVNSCLFAAHKLNNVDLARRIPMINDYMAIMGINHVQDAYYNRLLFISLFNSIILPPYCYVMTTLYDQRYNHVHWTEGLSYAQHWVEDRFTKTNLLIKDYDKYMLKKIIYPAGVLMINWNVFL
jgi:hypothetical protein